MLIQQFVQNICVDRNCMKTQGAVCDHNHYDQNQLKQHSYQIGVRLSTMQAQHELENKYDHKINQYGQISLKRKRSKFTKLPNIMTKNLPIQRKSSINSVAMIKSTQSNQIRHKSHSQSNPYKNQLISPLKLRKKANTILQQNQLQLSGKNNLYHNSSRNKIHLSQKQLNRAVNNLEKLIYEDKSIIQSVITQQQINQKLRIRYNLAYKINYQNLQEFSAYQLELPYCQFVGLKKSKDSIFKILNMSVRQAQKLAFLVYDRNFNKIIDQKDIIELFDQADRNQAIKDDLQILVKNYSTQITSYRSANNTSESPYRKISQFSNNSIINTARQFSQITIQSKAQTQNKPNNKNNKQQNNSKFEKQKFYTFLQTKNKFMDIQLNKKPVVKLDWNGFKKAFEGRRPKIFYDMIDYLFGFNSQTLLLKQQYAKQVNLNKNKYKQSYKINTLPDSVIRKDGANVRPIKKDIPSRMGTTKIGLLIKRAKSIERFQSIEQI